MSSYFRQESVPGIKTGEHSSPIVTPSLLAVNVYARKKYKEKYRNREGNHGLMFNGTFQQED